MTERWPIVVGVIAITGAVAWFAVRPHGATEATSVKSQGSGPRATAGADAGDGKAALRVPAPPVLDAGDLAGTPRPAVDGGDGSPSPQVVASVPATFAAQDRDPTWAPKTEAEIKRRFETSIHGAHLESAECRQDQCAIVVAGSQAEVTRTLDDVEQPKGLQDLAKHILLTAPEEQNGKLVLRFYAQFER